MSYTSIIRTFLVFIQFVNSPADDVIPCMGGEDMDICMKSSNANLVC